MNIKLKLTLLVIPALLLVIGGCSGDSSLKQATVKGQITVADSIDGSGDYSGIGVTIIKKDSANGEADTLYYAVTDKKGYFSGHASFSKHRQYPLLFNRNNQNIGQAGVILAADDTVQITAELPGIEQTLDIQSREHNALKSYLRVERSFQRVGAFAQAGHLKGDSLTSELKKWPGIFWQTYESNPQTLAGHLAAKKAIELLSHWDRPAMMKKISAIEGEDDLIYLAATYGKEYKAERENLDQALAYLNELESKAEKEQVRMRIGMERIDLLYDSAKIEEAKDELESFKNKFKDKIAKKWAQSITYDLNYLSPGDALPDFSFTENGKEISREAMKGRSYLLEITSLSNPLYQQQYDRSVVIHSIYKNYDFEIVTIPLDSSDITVQAFFEQRTQPWPVASAKTFAARELIERFNIKNLPTRFLVDREGRIVNRYVGDEYDDVIGGIQKTINSK